MNHEYAHLYQNTAVSWAASWPTPTLSFAACGALPARSAMMTECGSALGSGGLFRTGAKVARRFCSWYECSSYDHPRKNNLPHLRQTRRESPHSPPNPPRCHAGPTREPPTLGGAGRAGATCALHPERVRFREYRKEESHATEGDHRARGPGPHQPEPFPRHALRRLGVCLRPDWPQPGHGRSRRRHSRADAQRAGAHQDLLGGSRELRWTTCSRRRAG